MADEAIRDRLALSLDVGGLTESVETARRLAPWFGIAKVGYELYAEAGPEAFACLHDLGFSVFADLKLFDIPTTVERGARALARAGLGFVNAHAAGGAAMLRAFVTGLHDGAADAGVAPPIALAVTVLTSEPDVSAFDDRVRAARDGTCDGVVCSTYEVERAHAHGLRAMAPGIRLAGSSADDQARVATPEAALAAGADWLVIGRTVTAAADPEAAAEEVHRSASAGCLR
jgi:orotidine-5'-phosphate decarboxylase